MVCVTVSGRAWICFESRKKPEARKMPENVAESHQSAARFVSQRFIKEAFLGARW